MKAAIRNQGPQAQLLWIDSYLHHPRCLMTVVGQERILASWRMVDKRLVVLGFDQKRLGQEGLVEEEWNSWGMERTHRSVRQWTL